MSGGTFGVSLRRFWGLVIVIGIRKGNFIGQPVRIRFLDRGIRDKWRRHWRRGWLDRTGRFIGYGSHNFSPGCLIASRQIPCRLSVATGTSARLLPGTLRWKCRRVTTAVMQTGSAFS